MKISYYNGFSINSTSRTQIFYNLNLLIFDKIKNYIIENKGKYFKQYTVDSESGTDEENLKKIVKAEK
jgi:hypothetical protein